MGVRLFRFNTDLFNHYQFIWEDDYFFIFLPTGPKISSDEIEGIAIYKASLMIDQFGLEREKVAIRKWIRSNLKLVTGAIARWGIERRLLRLFPPYEFLYPKMFQMQLAKEFFPVPRASLHWGTRLDHREVIVKTLSGRPISGNTWFYAQKVDRHDLSPRYPWLTQDIAPGNRDATVV
ncbi:MAG: hypothetical protein MJ078_06430, partial [Clostridia bacterium]|nr:hypothetical protein [Clostridia bacterium]